MLVIVFLFDYCCLWCWVWLLFWIAMLVGFGLFCVGGFVVSDLYDFCLLLGCCIGDYCWWWFWVFLCLVGCWCFYLGVVFDLGVDGVLVLGWWIVTAWFVFMLLPVVVGLLFGVWVGC